MEEKQFKGRIEDIPFLGRLILVSFIRDKADFIELSPDYKDPFATNVEAKITLVEELINPKKLTGELKKLTQQLRKGYTHCRNFMNKIERYLEKAQKANLVLTMAVEDFGIRAVREAVNLKNDEGAVLHLRTLQQNLADNRTVLATKGYTEAIETELENLIKEVSDTSVAQTLKKKERQALVHNNIDKLNDLWFIIDDLMKTGKTICKDKANGKIKDYTYTDLVKDVQLKRKQEEEQEENSATKA